LGEVLQEKVNPNDSPPTGTLTFLFTDIEGSTTLYENYPTQMQDALVRHEQILRNAVEEHKGYVFKTVGDAFCAAFATARAALEAALASQRALFREQWPENIELRVRIALHTGVGEERDGGYFGPALNRVARLLGAGHGGQILLSEAAYNLVRDHLVHLEPEGELRDLGEHRLKGLRYPEHIFQLVAPELPKDFPPLKTQGIATLPEGSNRSPSDSDRVDPLLATKLFIPPARANLVARGRLTEQLDEGAKSKLTLVSAPAGFGKSTLLSEWSFKAELPVLWVSLDEGDNDPTRFLAYLVAALQRLQPALGENVLGLLRSPQRPPLESLLAALINEIAEEASNDFALVLDDYHLMEAQPIHDALTFLLEHLPPQMHLVIASRTDPPLPLARFLARGQLRKLTATDLRFTPEEAAAFLNEVMGFNLSAEDARELEERTEGWIAGLQLAALSMQGRIDISGFIAAFAGSHRYVLDYLAEEVLDKQPEDVQKFLLETSILDRMFGSLCDAVTDGNDSQAMLEMLERANLFLIPLDDERRWYRYHHLFADFLRKRLHQRHPELESDLHGRASEWYERNELPSEAIGHALRARDFGRAADLIEKVARQILMRFEVETLLGWLEALPKELVRSRPQLCLIYAGVFLSVSCFDAVEPYLQDAERLLCLDGESLTKSLIASSNNLSKDKKGTNVAGEVATIRAALAAVHGDMPRAIALSHRALELLAEDNLFVRSYVTTVLANAYRDSGDIEAASQILSEALESSQAAGATMVTLGSLWALAYLRVLQGRLREATGIYQQLPQFATEYGGGPLLAYTGTAYMGMGELLYEWDDLEAATFYLQEGIKLAESYGKNIPVRISPGDINYDYLWCCYGYCVLARVKQAHGDAKGALETIYKAKQLVQRCVDRVWRRWTAAWQARLWLAQGLLAEAAHWAEKRELNVEDELHYSRDFEYITLARLLIAQGEHHGALGLLERLLEAAEAGGRGGSVIEILVLKALVLQAQNDIPNALATLQRALSLAEPEGYVRTFVDEGPPMATLLKQLLKTHKTQQPGAAEPEVSLDYIGRLLKALGEEVMVVTKVRAREKAGLLVEPITERELEVLRLLASGLSNREIAKKLYVSLDTVKSHLKHIYGKLGARSRYQAVDRARELDLLQ
jgi:LuxR family maltose regulon positive regulatory protein